jgi:hypothetical protein
LCQSLTHCVPRVNCTGPPPYFWHEAYPSGYLLGRNVECDPDAMKLRLLACSLLIAGCGVDEADVSSTAQAVGRDFTHLRNTGLTAFFVASSEDGFQSVQLTRDNVALVPPPTIMSFAAIRYDLSSWVCRDYGCFYGVFTNSVGNIELQPNDAQMTINGVRLHATIPPNNGGTYSERCVVDLRVEPQSLDCSSLEGYSIDVAWEPTGESEVINGLQVYEHPTVTYRIAGQEVVELAYVSGMFLGEPLYSVSDAIIFSSHGSFSIETTQH